ncbi:GSCOCG00013491001-RA-CDS [Cotesia congregata]|nr:GSCOCG00013491001-RA-CDS [Cotesia congregata]
MFKTKKVKKIWENFCEYLNNLEKLLSDNNDNTIDDNLTNLINNLCKFSKELKLIKFKSDNCKKNLVDLLDDFVYETKSKENLKKNFLSKMDVGELKDNFKDQLKLIEDNEQRELLSKAKKLLVIFGEKNLMTDLEVRKLAGDVIEVIEAVKSYVKDLSSCAMREKIILCAMQLIFRLKLFVNLAEQREGAEIWGKNYLFNCLSVCLRVIIETIEEENFAEDEERENHFIYKMDLALDLINKMADEKLEMAAGDLNLNLKIRREKTELVEELWVVLEDIFSHTMAIAQICTPEQFNLMTGISKTVICEFENWKKQFLAEKRDKALFSLFGNAFMDAIYRLERAVNVAMLQLMMEVFSEPFAALKKLVKICGNSLEKDRRKKEDLEKAVEEFDLIADKALQIGLYAAASCGNSARGLKIRNHMASLESLDLELVASITSFYLEPSRELRSAVKLLTTQWQNEMNNLHKSINLILDPSAYCQVILDDLQERFQLVSDAFESHQPVTQSQIKVIVYRACALASQITTAVDDIGTDSIDKQTIMTIRELKAAIYETDAAAKTLLTPTSTLPQQLRVIKRCELLISVIRRLQPALEAINSKITSSFISRADVSAEESFNFIKTPYSVKSYKSTVTIQFDDDDKIDPSDLSCLIPYIERGRTMRSEFSVLYKDNLVEDEDKENFSGNKRGKNLGGKILQEIFDNNQLDGNFDGNSKEDIKKVKSKRNLNNVRQHLFNRDDYSIIGSDEGLKYEDFDVSLDLTGILENISGLVEEEEEEEERDDVSSVIDKEMDCCRNSSIDSEGNFVIDGAGDAGSISSIDTPERISDIKKIDKKIESLQRRVHFS